VSLKHLTSKLLAGGLTAGVVLIWWPRHYPTTGLEWLVLRGIVATLGFELMLLAYAPMEDRIARHLVCRKAVGRLRAKASAVPAPARTGGSLLFAGAALTLPIMLLATAGAPPVQKAQAQPVKTKIVRQVIVKRQVIHDEVVVPSAATAPAKDPAAAAAAPPPSGPAARTGPTTEKKRSAAKAPVATEQEAEPKVSGDDEPATPATTQAPPTATVPPAAATDKNAQTAVTETTPTG
jgi:hypothetical protein